MLFYTKKQIYFYLKKLESLIYQNQISCFSLLVIVYTSINRQSNWKYFYKIFYSIFPPLIFKIKISMKSY